MALDIRNVVNVGQSMNNAEETIQVDAQLSTTSKNPVENRVITQTLLQKQDALTVSQLSAVNSGINTTKRIAYDNHIADNDIHVTSAQKTAWSNKQDALVSGTSIKTVNNTSLLGSGNISVDSLPSQTGNSGKFLTTDGTSASWATVQTGGAPTITWYTGNTGTSVTIGSTANSDLVKVYKNGILLQPTADYTITYPVLPDNPESGDTLTMVTALVSTDKIAVEVF